MLFAKNAMQIITIMTVGAGFFWGGFPTALAFKFPVLTAGIITAAGAELAVLIVLSAGRPIQAFILKKFPRWLEKTRSGKAGAVLQKFGMPGLGLIAPIVPGAPQAALIGLALSAKPGKVLLWVSIGIVFWSTVVTAGLGLGIGFVEEFLKTINR